MQGFAIVCLICILIAVQHLVNWAMRKIWSGFNKPDTDLALWLSAILLIVAAIITFFTGKYLILWAYPFLNV